jgi:L-asparaginase
MPRLAVLFTGGTISMTVDPVAGGNVPTLDGAAILARAPGLDALAELVPLDLGRTPASHLTPTRLVEIGAILAARLADPGIDGALVVQGTDSIEETAFGWDLLLAGPKPVVVTGAMRSASEPGYDGPANLRDAVIVASSPLLRGSGVTVVLGGSIEAADDVVKSHTSSLTTFRSPNAGSLGEVVGGVVTLHRGRGPRRHVATERASERVHLLTAVTGMDGSLLDAAVAAGAEGIVVAGTGAGNTSLALLEAAERAIAAGIPVVLTTRAAAGRAGTAYAFPGGGATWARAGALLAGHLSGPKARIALALAIGAGLSRDELATLVDDPRWPEDGT